MILRIFVIFFILFSNGIYAEDRHLVTIESDAEEQFFKFRLELNKQADISGFHKDHFSLDGVFIKRQSFSISQVEQGVILDSRQGKDVLILKGHNIESHLGGELELIYLYNGITQKYKTILLSVQRLGDQWILNSENFINISHIKLVSNNRFGILLGVKEIIFK